MMTKRTFWVQQVSYTEFGGGKPDGAIVRKFTCCLEETYDSMCDTDRVSPVKHFNVFNHVKLYC